ncbi:hypothetical protein LTR17_009809 [Elasticomyces elasticus]|nr:hypothetical protein LTR22_011823 [Elasticomyces elasticus]KAK3658535.1 hypothetical protein LTR22_008888 [Elasticomyces elasticus]KAK4912412.1 hypothetical protein LTR49_019129 [Elasticomyces elasticus]KAK4921183.1 hypothetical protein LTR49_011370 [Elasticomyces elasticus]KAK5733320.1 hypothetical protein LTR17_009809 [Elasticomyces elasticus]
MARLSQVLTASLAVLGASASAVKDLIPSNFDDIVLNSGKPALVEFFAPWCGHCKTLAPIYEELATNFESLQDKVTIAKVDADAEKDLGRRFGVQGFPTLKWFDGKSDTPEDYKSGRDLESLTKFIQEKTGVKPKAKRAEKQAVEMLNDKTFKEQIGSDKDALVAFTAPWCGHCKTLAPTWEKVAQDFASESNVLIAKVDCEADNAKATAQDAGVKSYPTIFYYPKGSKEAVPYTGGRSEADLVSFMNEKAGTHRSVGGTLDALAGTIPSLDDMAKTLKSGGDAAYQKFAEAAGAVSDKYAEYYGKVAKKSSENAGYVEKELSRLQGLLAKGGLAPAKIDDLTTRSNILRKFVGDETPKDEL